MESGWDRVFEVGLVGRYVRSDSGVYRLTGGGRVQRSGHTEYESQAMSGDRSGQLVWIDESDVE